MAIHKVILDMDPGIDDAIALSLALSSNVEILGVTTVCGNVVLEKTTRNALKVLDFLGRKEIPVYPGSTRPLVKQLETAESVHGRDGLGDAELPDSHIKPRGAGAARFIVDTILSSRPKSITVVSTGPLTNLATAYLLEPTLPKLIRKHVAMCGAFAITPYGYGNVTPVSEFNAYVDPEAAKIVLGAESDKMIVGLDVTRRPDTVLDRDLCKKLDTSNTKQARLVSMVSKKTIDKYGYLQLHDPMALAASLNPSLMTTKEYSVDVITTEDPTVRGQTVADRRTVIRDQDKTSFCARAQVCVDVNAPLLLSFIMDLLVGK